MKFNRVGSYIQNSMLGEKRRLLFNDKEADSPRGY